MRRICLSLTIVAAGSTVSKKERNTQEFKILQERVLSNTVSSNDTGDCREMFKSLVERVTNGEVVGEGIQSCPVVWLGSGDADSLLQRILNKAKLEERSRFRENVSRIARNVLDSLPEKTVETAKSLVNVWTDKPDRDKLVTICDPKTDVKSITTIMNESGPTFWPLRRFDTRGQRRKYDNFLLPFVRLVNALKSCTDWSQYGDLAPIRLDAYIAKYLSTTLSATKTLVNDEDESGKTVNSAIEGTGDIEVMGNDGPSSMDSLNPWDLMSDLQRKKSLVDNTNALFIELRELGVQVTDAAARIIYISALSELAVRISQHIRMIQNSQGDVHEMIRITMDAIDFEIRRPT